MDYPAIIAVFIASVAFLFMVSALGKEASSNTKKVVGCQAMLRRMNHQRAENLHFDNIYLLICLTVTTYGLDHYFQVAKQFGKDG